MTRISHMQNRRHKVFNRGFAFLRGALRLQRGGIDILKIDKTSIDSKCFMFQFGGLEPCLAGLSPPKLVTWLSDVFCIHTDSVSLN